MSDSLVDNIARAVLYEGYILYPYRRSTKNHHRWTFGGIFPRDYNLATSGADPHTLQTQCLIRVTPDTRISLRVRFLHLIDRKVRNSFGQYVDSLEVEGKRYQSWQEAAEESIAINGLELAEQMRRIVPFSFPEKESTEPLGEKGELVRTQAPIEGSIDVHCVQLQPGFYRVTVQVHNHTPLADCKSLSRDQAALHSMASTHIVLTTIDGAFISMIDPPTDLKDLARQCKGIGLWPVLVGEPGQIDCLLAAPIILYDYPQVAPESPGDLFDGTEIDEILSLRILTLTDEEKRDAADLDPRGAAMLQRTQELAREQLLRLHGTMRPPRTVEAVHIGNAELRIGGHVRLKPRANGADAFDLILRGKLATITAIEQDYENRIHLAVTIDDDPGADIGAAGKIGHRFYFRPEEVDPIHLPQETQPT